MSQCKVKCHLECIQGKELVHHRLGYEKKNVSLWNKNAIVLNQWTPTWMFCSVALGLLPFKPMFPCSYSWNLSDTWCGHLITLLPLQGRGLQLVCVESWNPFLQSIWSWLLEWKMWLRGVLGFFSFGGYLDQSCVPASISCGPDIIRLLTDKWRTCMTLVLYTLQ